MKNMTKKALTFSILLTFVILLAACQLPAAKTEATSTVQETPSSTSVPTGMLTVRVSQPAVLGELISLIGSWSPEK